MLPESSATRKSLPVTEGVLHYFPDAIAYVALVSKVGNDKHNPGEPLHWSRGKSDDHLNCIGRHLLSHGVYGSDGILHDGNLAWRALANLQLTLEDLQKKGHDVFALFGGQAQNTAAVTAGDDHHANAQRTDITGNGGGASGRGESAAA